MATVEHTAPLPYPPYLLTRTWKAHFTPYRSTTTSTPTTTTTLLLLLLLLVLLALLLLLLLLLLACIGSTSSDLSASDQLRQRCPMQCFALEFVHFRLKPKP